MVSTTTRLKSLVFAGDQLHQFLSCHFICNLHLQRTWRWQRVPRSSRKLKRRCQQRVTWNVDVFFFFLLLLLLLLLPFNHQLMETNWRHASLPFDSRMFFSLPKGGVMSLISHTCCIHLVVSLFISKNNSDFLDYRMLECDVIRYMIYGYLE